VHLNCTLHPELTRSGDSRFNRDEGTWVKGARPSRSTISRADPARLSVLENTCGERRCRPGREVRPERPTLRGGAEPPSSQSVASRISRLSGGARSSNLSSQGEVVDKRSSVSIHDYGRARFWTPQKRFITFRQRSIRSAPIGSERADVRVEPLRVLIWPSKVGVDEALNGGGGATGVASGEQIEQGATEDRKGAGALCEPRYRLAPSWVLGGG